MNLRQKAAKGVAWSAIENWGNQAIYFVLFLVLARLLPPEAFGLVSLAGVFISFMMVFADQGISDAIVQRQELEPEHLDTAFWTNLGVSALLTIFSIAAAPSVSNLFHQPSLTPILTWLSLSFLGSGLSSVQQSLLRRQFAFRALAVRSLLAISLGGIVGVSMAYLGWGVWSLVGQQLVGRLVAVITLWWASDWRPGLRISTKHFKDLFSFGMNMLGSSILAFFSIRSDDFLIGYFLGPVALGYYTIAYRLLIAMTQMLSATTRQVALPIFSKLQQQTEQLRQAFLNATQLLSLFVFPASLGLVALAPEVVRSLFGEQWIPSVPVMQILALSVITQIVGTLGGIILVAAGKPDWGLKMILLNTVGNVIGFAIAVRWGIVAVAASFVIRDYLLQPVLFWLVYKLTGIKFFTYIRQFVVPLVGSLMMVISILGAKYFLSNLLNSQALLATCMALGAFIYIVTILLIAPKIFWQVVDFASLSLGFPKFRKT
ncbi:MAG TPA: flippase [Cyanobacteria bacterium UBA11049]|nr:flippase [Cyanobacteria bacterium UBA11049]